MAEKIGKGRFIAVIIVTALCFLAFLLRFAQYQLVEGAELRERADRTSELTVQVTAARGDIVDRYGRVLATTSLGYSVVIQKGSFPTKKQNEERITVILALYDILTGNGETVADSLPIAWDLANPAFTTDSDSAVAALKERLNKQDYATAENCVEALISRYGLEELPLDDARKVMGIRYEMECGGYEAYYQITVASDVSMTTITAIKEQQETLPGVSIVAVPYRVYTQPDIAAHIIGYTGPIYAEEYAELKAEGYKLNDTVGKSGIEKLMETYLRGKDGSTGYTTDGETTGTADSPVPGDTVVLTIDSALQKVAQDSLAETIQKIAAAGAGKENHGEDACAGAVVVIQIKTGEVLAAATYPTYSINDLLDNYNAVLNADNQPLYNRAFLGLYPPGSTYKPMISLAALQEGVITPSTRLTCNHIYTYYTDYQPKCLGTHGSISLTHALAVSCNCYFYEVGRLLTISKIEEYAAKFGLGEKTGVGLAESAGVVAGPTERSEKGEVWVPGDTLQAAIGQSDNLYTPLQLANYIATLCNHGTRYQPRIVKSVISKDQTEVLVEDAPVVAEESDFSAANVKAVLQGMLSVTTDGTGATVFGSYSIKVGGKTGSAEVSSGSPNAVFVAFAPYDDPEIAVAIVIEHGYHGGDAAQVVRDIFDAYFYSEGAETTVPEGVLMQ